LRAVHSDTALGLLVELDERGPVPVRDLMRSYDLCESDLHGLLAEFTAAGLVTETRVVGERGYELTDVAREGLAALRRE
jgi:DNA-binding IclR family transcriptional regulator